MSVVVCFPDDWIIMLPFHGSTRIWSRWESYINTTRDGLNKKILHLIELLDDLRDKIQESLEVLHLDYIISTAIQTNQLSSMALNEPLVLCSILLKCRVTLYNKQSLYGFCLSIIFYLFCNAFYPTLISGKNRFSE